MNTTLIGLAVVNVYCCYCCMVVVVVAAFFVVVCFVRSLHISIAARIELLVITRSISLCQP